MRQLLRITSNDNPRIKAVIRLRDSRDRRETGAFIAEGFREVERAMTAGLRLIEWYACSELLGFEVSTLAQRLPWRKQDGDAAGHDVSSNVLKKLAYKENPEGLIAVFEQPRWSWDSLVSAENIFWLVAVGIEKPGNLGAMARTAAAAGAGALIAVDETIDPLNPNAIRASTGAVFSLPVVKVDGATLMAACQARSIRLHAAMLTNDATPFDQVSYTGNTAIVIGAEDEGLAADWADKARLTGGGPVIIPMLTGHVDSLNASVAAGVLLFEAKRQREVK